MLYSDSEAAWLDRRAEKIAEERGWPLPIARSEAAADMVRMRTRKACCCAAVSPAIPDHSRAASASLISPKFQASNTVSTVRINL